MLSFEIGQRKGGFYSVRTDRRTELPSTVLVYRLLRFTLLMVGGLKYHSNNYPFTTTLSIINGIGVEIISLRFPSFHYYRYEVEISFS